LVRTVLSNHAFSARSGFASIPEQTLRCQAYQATLLRMLLNDFLLHFQQCSELCPPQNMHPSCYALPFQKTAGHWHLLVRGRSLRFPGKGLHLHKAHFPLLGCGHVGDGVLKDLDHGSLNRFQESRIPRIFRESASRSKGFWTKPSQPRSRIS